MARIPPSYSPASSSSERSDRELLARIQRSAGGKAGYKQLIRELGLGGGRERRLLLEQLARLVARGELTFSDDRMWSIPPPETTAPPTTEDLPPTSQSRSETAGAAGRSGRDRLLTGRLDLHREGYGFVRPNRGPSRGPAGAIAEDLFIPPHALNGAMQGDLVLVEQELAGRSVGRILRVLTRQNPTIVGVFHSQDRDRSRRLPRQEPLHSDFVTPWDERMGGPILIAAGDAIPPAASNAISGNRASPHRLLGEPARQELAAARGTDRLHPLEGLVVDVEILSFPTLGRPARGRVIEVLGPPDGFGVDVEIVIRKHQIPHRFPTLVLEEAEDRALEQAAALDPLAPPDPTATPGPAPLHAREDFRALPIVTIDGESARDFDDAVLVRRLPNGNDELQVHIADVSWYVRSGSALDTEARFRGTSVYFPDRAIPMLPHALSSGICSLLPGQDRLVLSCIMEIDSEGEIAGYRLAEGIIRSRRRMTYTSVQHCLNAANHLDQIHPDQRDASAPQRRPATPGSASDAGSGEAQPGTPPPSAEDIAERERIGLEHPELPSVFDAMLRLALRLNAKRVRRGSIDFDLPEPVVEFDPDGNMKAIVRSERGWAHRLIEEFMLSANECVAHWLEGRGLNRPGVPSLYRIHETPDPKKIVEFEETAAAFGRSLGIGSLPVRTVTLKADRRELRQRAAQGRNSARPHTYEIPASIPVTPQMYQDLLRRIRATPEERILSYLMLRSLKQARYAEKNQGHFALASPCYTHFTSPIRRYPDLVVHRLVRAMLRQGTDPRGAPIRSDDLQPWQAAWKARTSATPAARASMREQTNAQIQLAPGPIAAEELNDIAIESSQAERRAAEAERELIEWKKMKFMADKIGDDFPAVILSVTRHGFFVELDGLFIEGMVPIGSLTGDHYTYRDTDRTIVGARTGHVFTIGQPVQVLLDRIDRQQRRLQFALLPGTEPGVLTAAQGRGGKSEAKKAKAKEKTNAGRTGAKAKRRKAR